MLVFLFPGADISSSKTLKALLKPSAVLSISVAKAPPLVDSHRVGQKWEASKFDQITSALGGEITTGFRKQLHLLKSCGKNFGDPQLGLRISPKQGDIIYSGFFRKRGNYWKWMEMVDSPFVSIDVSSQSISCF